MGMTTERHGKKDLNVELNLLPVFDILSVCICFLLMSVVWVEVRTLETKQTFGSEKALPDMNAKAVWIEISPSNKVSISLKKGDQVVQKKEVIASKGQINFSEIKKTLLSMNKPAVQPSSGQILPAANTSYQDVMSLFDLLKTNGIQNLGLSPI